MRGRVGAYMTRRWREDIHLGIHHGDFSGLVVPATQMREL